MTQSPDLFIVSKLDELPHGVMLEIPGQSVGCRQDLQSTVGVQVQAGGGRNRVMQRNYSSARVPLQPPLSATATHLLHPSPRVQRQGDITEQFISPGVYPPLAVSLQNNTASPTVLPAAGKTIRIEPNLALDAIGQDH